MSKSSLLIIVHVSSGRGLARDYQLLWTTEILIFYSRKENSSRHNFMYSNFLVFALIKACGVCWLSRVPELTICRKMSLQSLERPVDTQMSCVRHKHNFLLLSKFSFLPARRIINSFSYTKPTNGINCIIMAYWVKSGTFCTGNSETEKYIK